MECARIMCVIVNHTGGGREYIGSVHIMQKRMLLEPSVLLASSKLLPITTRLGLPV